jgi:hypothetical protein
MICPSINNQQVFNEFNDIVISYGGKPLTIEEFKDVSLRENRKGIDKHAMDMAYYVWDAKESGKTLFSEEEFEIAGKPVNLLQLKIKIANKAESKIAAMNEQIKILRITSKDNPSSAINDKILDLQFKINKLHDYLYGANGEYGAKEIIAKLQEEMAKTPVIVEYYINKEIERLDFLINSNDVEMMEEAREIIMFIASIRNFDPLAMSRGENMLFEYDEVYKDNVLIIPKEWREVFDKWEKTVTEYMEILSAKEKEMVEKLYSEKMDDDKSYTEIMENKKDITWIDAMVMDAASGILSTNGPIAQAILKTAHDAFNSHETWALNEDEKMTNLLPKVQKKLTQLGYHLKAMKIFGVSSVSYELFRQIRKNGFPTGNIVDKFIPEWYESLYKINKRWKDESHSGVATEYSMENETVARNKWLKQNAKMINPTMIEELWTEFSDILGTRPTVQEMEKEKQELIALVGDKYYSKLVNMQKENLKNYKSKMELQKQLLSEKEFDIWNIKNSPIEAVRQNLTNSFTYQNHFNKMFSYNNYNLFVPLDKTNQDSKYKEIEQHDELLEFHLLITNGIEQINARIAGNSSVGSKTIPMLEKSLIELMMDDGLFKASVAKEIWNRTVKKFKSIYTIGEDNQFSKAKRNMITGELEYEINDSFLQKNAKRIKIEMTLASVDILSKIGENFKRLPSVYYINKNRGLNHTDMADILSPYLEKPYTAQMLQDKYGDEIPVYKIVNSYIHHKLAMESTFDLPKIMRMYTFAAAKYAARQEMMPLINMMKKHYNAIKSPATNASGQPLINAKSKKPYCEGPRKKAVAQMNDWFERVVIGNTSLKHNYGVIRDFDKKGNLSEMLNKVTKGKRFSSKIYDNQEKEMIKRIDALLKQGVSEEEEKELLLLEQNLGSYFAVSAIVDSILTHIRFLGLGFGLSSGITNFLEGQIANRIVSSSGIYFDPDEINYVSPSDLILGDSLRKVNAEPDKTKIARHLAKKYNVIMDSSNELQKASVNSKWKFLNRLNPYYPLKKTEEYNQLPLLVAVLRSTFITDEAGNRSSVFNAFEVKDGIVKMKDSFRKTNSEWDTLQGQNYIDFKAKMEKVIMEVHGDYTNTYGMMVKSNQAGKILMMFKTWLPREIHKRFGIEYYDSITKTTVKGRYRSLTPTSAALMFGTTGMVSLGPVGALVGMLMGTTIGFITNKSDVSFGKEFLKTMKMSFKTLTGMVANPTLRAFTRKTFIKSDTNTLGMSEADWKNHKANVQDIATMLALFAIMLLVKSMFWDDDDDKKDASRIAHNLLVNKLMILSSSGTQYINLVEMSSTITSVAFLRWLDNVHKTVMQVEPYLQGEDINVNTGEHKLYSYGSKVMLPSIMRDAFGGEALFFGMKSQSEKQFVPSPFDKWFESDEKSLKKKIKQEKAAIKKYLEDEGYDKEDEEYKIMMQELMDENEELNEMKEELNDIKKEKED